MNVSAVFGLIFLISPIVAVWKVLQFQVHESQTLEIHNLRKNSDLIEIVTRNGATYNIYNQRTDSIPKLMLERRSLRNTPNWSTTTREDQLRTTNVPKSFRMESQMYRDIMP